MKSLSRKTTKIGVGIGSFLFLVLPLTTLARVQITEVMYDVPGADSGREWVEITNTSSESIDVGKYRFFENDTNHGLKLISGVSTLAPGTSAVLASDANKFLSDHPYFSGILFDTAFSLSNTGESLSLKNASSTIEDTIFYTATEDANGTSGSLQLKDDGFVASLATPGVYPGTFVPVPKAPVKETKGKSGVTSLSQNSKNVPQASSTIFSKFDSPVSQSASLALSFNWLPGWWPWALGLLAVILLGVSGVLFLLSREPETLEGAEGFTIE